VGSEYSETAVDEIDFSSLSDDQLQDIVDNDERSTARDKAQAELNRRESADDSDAAESSSAGDKGFSVTSATSPDDPIERAEALGINSEGINLDPDAGQLAVQDYFDAVEESGVIPPTGGPPDDSLTVAKVTEREAADKAARREAQEEAVGK